MRRGIYLSPHTLYLLPKKLVDIANQVLPVDTGIEIEINDVNCKLRNFSLFNHCNLVDINWSIDEFRFRIPSGVKGLISLYDTLEVLKEHAGLNLDSGIHYHIDCTQEFSQIVDKYIQNKNGFNWILDELDSWGYSGSYNKRQVSSIKTWVKLHQGCRTMEFRIGEMSFDYQLIVKRILHCHNIVKKVKRAL